TGFSATWGTVQASGRYSEGALRIGVSGGIDVPINGGDMIQIDAIAKFAASVGIEQGDFGFGVGYVLLHAVGTSSSSSADSNISGINITVDFAASPTVRVFGAFGKPDIENDDSLGLYAFGAGVRVSIP